MVYQKIAKSASSIAQNSEKVASPAPRSVNSSPTPISQLTQNFTQIPVHSPIVQAKLTIGSPNDRYEQEADRVAAQVVQQLHHPATIQRQDELDGTIQAKSMLQRPDAIVTGDAPVELSSAIDRQRGGGQALDIGLQQSMGRAMGADFSQVRVHTDGQSDRLNRSIEAKAFTTGHDVFFRQGGYVPGSRRGQELIAHELTHVVQQNQGRMHQHDNKMNGETGERQNITSSSVTIQCNGQKKHLKKEKTKRKQDWRLRRDRKMSGKSAGSMEFVTESLTKNPLKAHEIDDLKQKGTISPHRVRTAQNTAKEHFSDGLALRQTSRKIKKPNEKQQTSIPAIKLFRHNNQLYTLDHRRLIAYRFANKMIQYEVVNSNSAEDEFIRKFSSKDNGMSIKIVPTEKLPYGLEDIGESIEEADEIYDDENDEDEIYDD